MAAVERRKGEAWGVGIKDGRGLAAKFSPALTAHKKIRDTEISSQCSCKMGPWRKEARLTSTSAQKNNVQRNERSDF